MTDNQSEGKPKILGPKGVVYKPHAPQAQGACWKAALTEKVMLVVFYTLPLMLTYLSSHLLTAETAIVVLIMCLSAAATISSLRKRECSRYVH